MRLPDDEHHLFVEHLSDADAAKLISRKLRKRSYSRKRQNKPPDLRPMCAEGYGNWTCPNRATMEYEGKPCCGIHRKMYASRAIVEGK